MAPAEVDEVILGQTKQSADAANLARVAALKAGFPVEVPAYTVMRQCGSGLQAVHNAVQAIWSGEAEIVVAGGVESMSLAPYYLRGARFGFIAGNTVVVDSNTESQPRSQPYEVYGDLTMGLTAENLAEEYDIPARSRTSTPCAARSAPSRPSTAGGSRTRSSRCRCPPARGPPQVFDTDEYPRRTSLEQLAALKPAFKEGGTVTAGNSSGRNDGAACLVLMAAETARERGLEPLADGPRARPSPAWTRATWASGRPRQRARRCRRPASLWPTSASSRSTRRSPRRRSPCVRELGLDQEITNVNGGAIALGHPLGCSGARILTTLLHEMRRRGTRYGLAGICIAGGQGLATIVEAAG